MKQNKKKVTGKDRTDKRMKRNEHNAWQIVHIYNLLRR